MMLKPRTSFTNIGFGLKPNSMSSTEMEIDMETFDDQKLINLARYNYFAHKTDERPEGIVELFTKDKLTNPERNQLLAFLETSKVNKRMSVRDMKNEIFGMIGKRPTSNSWSTTVSRDELEIILNFVREVYNGR
jgi:hypothetical protein